MSHGVCAVRIVIVKMGYFFSVTHDHYCVKCFHNESNKVDVSVITYYRIMKELWNIIAAEQ